MYESGSGAHFFDSTAAWRSAASPSRLTAPTLSLTERRGIVLTRSASITVEFEPPERPEWQDDAKELQDDYVEADLATRAPEVARILALVAAFDGSMADLRRRRGAEYASRHSLGAQTFFKSLGLRSGKAPKQLAHQYDTATSARELLPRTWAVFLRGDASWRALDLAVGQCYGPPADRTAAYDERAAELVQSTPSSRLKGRLAELRERLQDDTAEARAKRTEDQRSVVADREADGGASMTIVGPAAPIVAFDQALTKAAVAAKLLPGEERTVTQLRHDITVDLLVDGLKQAADPNRQGLRVPTRSGVTPTVVLTIPVLAALGRTAEQGRIARYGPIALGTAKKLAGKATSFVRVLTDPVTGVRTDMDRIPRVPPADMRRWVTLRDELCRFPGCNRPAHLCDVDHAKEWQHGGVTATDNLVSVCRPEHRAKSAELWQEELLADGVVRWEDPWGNTFDDPPATAADPVPADLLADDAPF